GPICAFLRPPRRVAIITLSEGPIFPPEWLMVRTRIVPAFLAGLVLLAAAGCQDETIRTYQAARIEAPPTRLLGAILPVRERVWFATVSGPASAVGELLPQFEAFVMSLRFPENERRLVNWTLPA